MAGWITTKGFRPFARMLPVAAALILAGPASAESPLPSPPVLKIAQISATYIAIIEHCGGDAAQLRSHYGNRVDAAALSDDDRREGRRVFDSAVEQSRADLATSPKGKDFCQQVLETPWTDYRQAIDDLIAGKGRF